MVNIAKYQKWFRPSQLCRGLLLELYLEHVLLGVLQDRTCLQI